MHPTLTTPSRNLSAPGEPEQPSVSLLTAGLLVVRNIRWLVGMPLLCAAVLVGFTLLRPQQYVAMSSFRPQTASQGVSSVMSLASQFGFDLPTTGGEPLDFYVRLATSRPMLERAAASTYQVRDEAGRTRTVTLADVYGFDADDSLRTERAVQRLARNVSVSVDAKSGVVLLNTKAPSEALAVQINRRLLDLINEFNISTRQTQASAERKFVEQRLAEAQQELRGAEAELRSFSERNRAWQASPGLSLEYSRLERQVALRQEVVNGLAQSFEQARIAEVRDIPVITVLEPPSEPAARRANSLTRSGLMGLTLGLLLGAIIVALREYVAAERRARPADYAMLKDALAHPLRRRPLR